MVFHSHVQKEMCTGFVFSGQKYEFAKKWNVYCISIHWLFDSIEKGFCQDESRYAVEREDKRKEQTGRPNTSTPTGSNKSKSKKNNVVFAFYSLRFQFLCAAVVPVGKVYDIYKDFLFIEYSGHA